MKRITYILLIFLISCGYQPIYLSEKKENLTFNEIELKGDKEINDKIINLIGIKKDNNSSTQKKLDLNSFLNIIETSKNSKGEVTSYKSVVTVSLSIEQDGQIIKKKRFIQDFSYNKRDNKFDLVEYQNEIKKNIINKIIDEIIVYINL